MAGRCNQRNTAQEVFFERGDDGRRPRLRRRSSAVARTFNGVTASAHPSAMSMAARRSSSWSTSPTVNPRRSTPFNISASFLVSRMCTRGKPWCKGFAMTRPCGFVMTMNARRLEAPKKTSGRKELPTRFMTVRTQQPLCAPPLHQVTQCMRKVTFQGPRVWHPPEPSVVASLRTRSGSHRQIRSRGRAESLGDLTTRHKPRSDRPRGARYTSRECDEAQR